MDSGHPGPGTAQGLAVPTEEATFRLLPERQRLHPMPSRDPVSGSGPCFINKETEELCGRPGWRVGVLNRCSQKGAPLGGSGHSSAEQTVPSPQGKTPRPPRSFSISSLCSTPSFRFCYVSGSACLSLSPRVLPSPGSQSRSGLTTARRSPPSPVPAPLDRQEEAEGFSLGKSYPIRKRIQDRAVPTQPCYSGVTHQSAEHPAPVGHRGDTTRDLRWGRVAPFPREST